ncbi:interactor of HORMAD1 protein 1 [Denticeps clupeoides]|uniref:interactor of HORMAD1 protein 1 n=1 Tax=Denticeps clupeoides TaxID=299321 RepID=UPI0010A526F8|nr:interactor of HORMAD1 protein 1 [Denticeps clupeoides]
MKTNVWNIKEMFNIPTWSVETKTASNGGTAGDSLSLTDSQFLGSQNSQSLSQDACFPFRNSRQNSQEGSELRLSTNYHTKPYLFGGEYDNQINTGSKPLIGILDRFEEHKNRVKEKIDSEKIILEFQQLSQTLEKAKIALDRADENRNTTNSLLEEGINSLTKTMQENMAGVQDSIMSQFQEIKANQSSQGQNLKDLEEREAKTAIAAEDLSSHVQRLQHDLESLRKDHVHEFQLLAEIQSILTTFIDSQAHMTRTNPARTIDNMVQTSPDLAERLWVVTVDKDVQLCGSITGSCSEMTTTSEKQGNSVRPECNNQVVPMRTALHKMCTNQVNHAAEDRGRWSMCQSSYSKHVIRYAADAGDATVGSHTLDSSKMKIPAVPVREWLGERPTPAKVLMRKNVNKKRKMSNCRKKPLGLIRAQPVYRTTEEENGFCTASASPDIKVEKTEWSSLITHKQQNTNELHHSENPDKENIQSAQREPTSWNMCSKDTSRSELATSYESEKAHLEIKIPQRAQGGFWELFHMNDSD